MLVLVGATIVVAVFLAMVIIWGRKRLQSITPSPAADAALTGESVRVDLQRLREIPSLAHAVEKVKWTRLEKQNAGHTEVGGVVVFGPKQLTWAPDDRARTLGVSPWQIPWADIDGGAVRTATSTASAKLDLTLSGGVTLQLSGVNEPSAMAALRRLPVAGSADSTD